MPVKPRTLRAVHPNVGFEIAYQKKLLALVEAMHRSVRYWVCVAYRSADPEMLAHMAQDDSPARMLYAVVRRLTRRWQRQFAQLAPNLARYFATGVAERTDEQLQSILRKAGISVRFTMSRAANDVVQATVAENVRLIRSIAEQHLNEVEGIVMRSVAQGRDLEHVASALTKQFGVTKRRAAFIAIDQNNRATANTVRLRQAEVGIEEAIWMHSGAGRHPRPTHVAAGAAQTRYSVKEGWYDPAEKRRIFPGELIRCRCVSKPIVPGFS